MALLHVSGARVISAVCFEGVQAQVSPCFKCLDTSLQLVLSKVFGVFISGLHGMLWPPGWALQHRAAACGDDVGAAVCHAGMLCARGASGTWCV